MRPMRSVLVTVILIVQLGVSASSALAERSPTSSEVRSIRAVAMAYCHAFGTPSPCVYGSHATWPALRTRVSTVNARYAWADVFTDGLSGELLLRPHPYGGGWRILASGGGGLTSCSAWFRAAPRRVIKDLRLQGGVRGPYGEVEATC